MFRHDDLIGTRESRVALLGPVRDRMKESWEKNGLSYSKRAFGAYSSLCCVMFFADERFPLYLWHQDGRKVGVDMFSFVIPPYWRNEDFEGAIKRLDETRDEQASDKVSLLLHSSWQYSDPISGQIRLQIGLLDSWIAALRIKLGRSRFQDALKVVTLRQLKPYQGWFLGKYRSDFSSFLEEVPSILPGSQHLQESESRSSAGLDFVLKCIMEAFPDGKGSTTWSDVERRTGVSRRNINRAVERFELPGWKTPALSGQRGGQGGGQDKL